MSKTKNNVVRFKDWVVVNWSNISTNLIVAIAIITFSVSLIILSNSDKTTEKEYQKMETLVYDTFEELKTEDILIGKPETTLTRKISGIEITVNASKIEAKILGKFGFVEATFDMQGNINIRRITEKTIFILRNLLCSVLLTSILGILLPTFIFKVLIPERIFGEELI